MLEQLSAVATPIWEEIGYALERSGHLPKETNLDILDNALFYEFGRYFLMASRCLARESMLSRPSSVFEFVDMSDMLGDDEPC